MVESKTIEWKREYKEDLKYTILAFANTDGGTIYVGVNDDGSIRGIDDTDEALLRITNMVRDTVRPDVTMFIDYAVENMGGKNVIVLTVQRGTARPYYLASKGVRPEGVYVRQGASSVPASETAILSMIRETGGDHYEDARSLNQQLTFDKATARFLKRGIEFGDAQKRTLNIIGPDDTYSNLGMLLSDQCIHTIKLAVFDGSKKSVFRDRRELTGSLLEQLDAAYEYISQFNRTRAEFQGLERIDRRDYPEAALREALLNAIVHREYAMSGAALISVFDDRIEFATIGGLVRGMSLNDIMLGISVLRNPRLANVFYRLNLIEAYGTGMLKIKESYADHGLQPQIEVTDNAFKMTLPNVNYYYIERRNQAVHFPAAPLQAATKNNREEAVIHLFEQQESIGRKDVQTTLNVSQATAVKVVRELVEKGVLIKESGGKYSRYRLGAAYAFRRNDETKR